MNGLVDILTQLLTALFFIVLFSKIITSAFSQWSRKYIGARDNWTCVRCGKSFHDGWMVHAAHYNHDRAFSDYDSPANGRILCVDCHQKDHEQQNDKYTSRQEHQYAVEKLRKTDRRTKAWRKRHGG